MKPLEAIPVPRSKERFAPPKREPIFIEAIDPATGAVIGTVPVTAEARIAAIISQAQKAQESWGRLTFAERVGPLTRLRDLIAQRSA